MQAPISREEFGRKQKENQPFKASEGVHACNDLTLRKT